VPIHRVGPRSPMHHQPIFLRGPSLPAVEKPQLLKRDEVRFVSIPSLPSSLRIPRTCRLRGSDYMPVSALGPQAGSAGLLQNVQFFFGGRQYCWYWDGWHGPGWYRCGYALRRGIGWGGPRGWRGWGVPDRGPHFRPGRPGGPPAGLRPGRPGGPIGAPRPGRVGAGRPDGGGPAGRGGGGGGRGGGGRGRR
jgi:hypothetical protein